MCTNIDKISVPLKENNVLLGVEKVSGLAYTVSNCKSVSVI